MMLSTTIKRFQAFSQIATKAATTTYQGNVRAYSQKVEDEDSIPEKFREDRALNIA